MYTFAIELRQIYSDLITTIVPGPASWSYFVPVLLLPLGLLIPPSTLSHGQLCAVVLLISLAATAHAWYVLGGNDVISTDCLYMIFFLYVFKDPRRDFKRIVRPGPCKESQECSMSRLVKRSEYVVRPESVFLEDYPQILSSRLIWAIKLLQSRPLHAWIIGDAGHDRSVLLPFQHPTRIEFTLDMFSRLSPVLFILLPLSKQLAKDDPYFHDPAWSILSPHRPGTSPQTATAAFLKNMLPPTILRPLTMAMFVYSLLLGIFLPPMLLPVLLNSFGLIPSEWSPHTWRPHFGPFSAIADSGVRGFWGRWWHQQMRHILSEPGRWAAVKLGLDGNDYRKSLRYILIYVSAFTLSGITHSGVVPPKPRFADIDTNKLRLGLAGFFWVQPVGIAVEVLFLEPILHNLPPSVRGLQGGMRIVWTAVFICSTCTLLVVPFGQLGYWNIISSSFLPPLP